jgi:hypothetical protein
MPTVMRKSRYRFFFFSRETNEPPHIHIEAEDDYAKFWLAPVKLAASYGFKSHELRQIQEIIEDNIEVLRRSWDEHFQR